jgi:hypothetical protein
MDWKSFLRPTWEKLSIFLTLALLFSWVLLYPALNFTQTVIHESVGQSPAAFEAAFVATVQQSGAATAGLTYNLEMMPITAGLNYLFPQPYPFVGYTFLIAYWYLLSCIVVWFQLKLSANHQDTH